MSAELAPAETFTKTWELLNTGSCTWRKTYSIAFESGNDMDGTNTVIDQSVAPGEEAEISVSLSAPDDDATYIGYWRLADGSGSVFGEKVYVQIVVGDAATATATATATVYASMPTTTATSTATVHAATSTARACTSTPTAVPATVTMAATDTATDFPTATPEISPTDTPNG